MLIDVSRSMSYNGKLEALNKCIREMLELGKTLDCENTEISMEFWAQLYGTGPDGNECRWITPTPIPVSVMEWTDVHARGSTPMGGALEMLDAAIDEIRHQYTSSALVAPAIVLLSDGHPWVKGHNERAKVEKMLERLEDKPLYKASIKVAVGIGDDTDKPLLERFTGSADTVFDVYDEDRLREILKFTFVTSSMMRTKMRSDSNGFAMAARDFRKNNG